MANILHILRTLGLDLKQSLNVPAEVVHYLRDRKDFRAVMGTEFTWGPELPILGEWNQASGALGGYFLQDRLVARWIYEANPTTHVDVGSRIDGFIGHLSVFREVEVLDIRPQPQSIPNVKFHQVDLMDSLPIRWIESTGSLSCLHTIEHFGLGRYGDPIDPDGHVKGLAQLKKLVRPGGLLYLSTPIGPQRLEFNAHRIFSTLTLLGWFAEGWQIERFAYLDDAGVMHEDVDWHDSSANMHFGCKTGLGILAARKLTPASP